MQTYYKVHYGLTTYSVNVDQHAALINKEITR